MAWVGMLVTLVGVGCARLAFGTVLPEMRADLNLSYTQAGSLGTLTALGYLLLLLPAGQLARRWSNRGSVVLGLSVITAGFLGLWLVRAFLPLQLLMGLLGAGTAFVFTPLISLLTGWFPRKRGTVIGMATSGVGLGVLLSGVLVPRLALAYGPASWRLVWAVFAVLAALSVLLSVLVLRDPPTRPQGVEGVGAAGGKRSGSFSAYRNPGVLLVGAAYGLGGFAFSMQTIFMLSYTLSAGVSPTLAGTLVAVNGLLSVASGVGWGWISDHLGRGPAMVLAASLGFLAMLAPVVWPTLLSFGLHYVVVGLTISGLFTLFQASGTEQVSMPDAPIALSAITVFYASGQLLGPAVAGILIDASGGFRSAFLLASLALLLTLILTFRIHHSARTR